MEQILINGKILNRENLEANKNLFPEEWQQSVFQFLQDWFDDSEVIISRTSGSTGKPKEIHLRKEAMRNSARMTNDFFDLRPGKTALLCLPATYIAGKMMLVRAIVGGFQLLSVEPHANPFTSVNEHIDFTAITPYQLTYSAETLKTKDIKSIIVGGGHVNNQLEKTAETIPAELYETYGMTETASHVALRCFNGKYKSQVFTALKGVMIQQDERGCLIINAPHLSDTQLVTNDIVEIVGKNNFRWMGRADSVINSGGIKVFPEQVEKKLEQQIQQPFFIASMPDAILGQKVILVLESEDPDALQKLQSRKNLFSMLDKYEIPKEIFVCHSFRYSESNKILRKETLATLLSNH